MESNLDDVVAFMAVARELNFTRAAAQLGISQSALSRTVRSFEEAMGMPLLVRTTRSVSLTDAGERLVANIGPHVREIRTELDAMRSTIGRPAGTVRITSTTHATKTYVWPRIQKLLADYPELNVEIVNDYALTDIVADRFDIGVRLGAGVAQDMIAARIAPDLTMAIVAAPSYLQRASRISTPQDLLQHNCITMRLPTRDSILQWELKKGKRQVQVKARGQLTFNNVYQIVDAAMAGFGLAYVPKDIVEGDVESGRLKWVLEEWFPSYDGLHVYYPSRNKSSRAVDLVVEALKQGYVEVHQ